MKKKRKIEWFVEPLDSETNEKMAKYLSTLNALVEQCGMRDRENQEHLVYQVPDYSVITRFYKDERKFNLKFKVYYRQNGYGPIKLWLFGEK